jgi:hypothetical protein
VSWDELMSPNGRFTLTWIFIVVIAALLGMAMVKLQSYILAAAFLSWVFVAAHLLSRVKCPRCNVPLTYDGQFLGITLHSGFHKTRCKACGHDLNKP